MEVLLLLNILLILTIYKISKFIVFTNLWKNFVKIWHVRIACWIPKAKNTHSDYVVHIALMLNDGW